MYQSTILKHEEKNEICTKRGLNFGARRRFVVDEDGGGVKGVPIDSNLDELDSIRIGTHFKLSRTDILEWK